MSENQIKLVAKLPKGAPNGFADGLLAENLCAAVTEGRDPASMVAVLVLDVRKVEIDPETGASTAHLRIRRAQPVLTTEGRRAVETVLFDEYSAEHGPVLDLDVRRVTDAAFRDLPRTVAEVDEREAREQENMSAADELRRHLERVHSHEEALTLTDGEAQEQHRKDHDGDTLPTDMQHDREWIGWTRADIELNAGDGTEEGEALDPSTAGGVILSDPGSEHLDDEGGWPGNHEPEDIRTRII